MTDAGSPDLQWIPFPDESCEVLGLPWFPENAPALYRFPARVADSIPERVWRHARCPAGGRLRFTTSSSRLYLRCSSPGDEGNAGIDVFVDGVYRRSVSLPEQYAEVPVLEEIPGDREITLYLPHRRPIEIRAIGLDPGASLSPGKPFPAPAPLVLYGSSVAQGAGTPRPGMSYLAHLGRRLNLDIVNLGFGGAGKAEAEVVELVKSIEARCYLFDLGKSYGAQDATAYIEMLRLIRSTYPDIPCICIAPIHSIREVNSPEYSERSVHTRDVVGRAVAALREAGDEGVLLVEGTDLLGSGDVQGLSEDGVHPSDLGFSLIADRLEPLLRRTLGAGGGGE